MTTIAWDGKTLAVDSFETSSNVIVSRNRKKLFLDVGDYAAVAVCGCTYEMLSFVEWLRDKTKSPPNIESGAAICIDRKGKVYSYYPKNSTTPVLEKGNLTDGSGHEIALGALDAGATAVEAVKIACKRNVYTGGKVQSYTHSDLPRIFKPANKGRIPIKDIRKAVKKVAKP